MLDVDEDIETLSEFTRDTSRFLERMKETGRPFVLTVDGEAEIVVQDVRSYRKLLDRIDGFEAIEGIKQGLRDVEVGRTRPLDENDREMRRKYRVSG